MRIRGEFVEGSLDLHLHGLCREVARFHILMDLQQLVRDLPSVNLQEASSASETQIPFGNGDENGSSPPNSRPDSHQESPFALPSHLK